MSKYRKKPVVIEAFHYTGQPVSEWPEWAQKAYYSGTIERKQTGLLIHTLEGKMLCRHGQWVIKGVQDELYPCDHAVFAQTYEAIDVSGAEIRNEGRHPGEPTGGTS